MLRYIEFHGLCELAFWARPQTHGYVPAREFGASNEADHVLEALLSRGLVRRSLFHELQPHVLERLEPQETFHRLTLQGAMEVHGRAIPGIDLEALMRLARHSDQRNI